MAVGSVHALTYKFMQPQF